ncbi:hypothetical protein [Streptomyces lydicus]|uniref:hypothetical protein n=1 Tax=Streptomyces lydicus TaxID=47763 RepID=UPI0005273B2A|nr:hypothetical protein [Streptomyces lydicus]MDC7336564.1 hypothetical protein [Streptomyces lydicus]UEG94107.1 hypothetical protein LJ741_28340 [Streptomyces lydicus]
MEAGPRNRAQRPDNGADTAPLSDDGPDTQDGLPGTGADRPGPGPLTAPDTLDDSDAPDLVTDGTVGPVGPGEGGESFRELRPPRRLRLWQLAPIVGLAAVGSLMFAFPLAFEFGGDGGAVIAMLGLLLCCCAAGWGMMAARRVGHTWPGLPARGSGRRASWRVVLVYALVVAVPASLAIWRVARLR